MTITLDGTTGVTTPGTTLSGGTANGVLYLNGSKVATSGSALTFDGNSLTVNGGASHTNFYLNNGTYSTLYYQNTGGASGVSVSGANYWTVTTNNAEQMRIDSSGNLLVGTTSTSHTTDGFTVEQGGVPYVTRGSSGTFMGFYNLSNSTLIGYISNNGGTSTSYNTTSDYRLKENIQPMQNALAVVAQLKPCTYNWKADGSVGQGFIAHELQAVIPDCVTGEKDAVNADGSIKTQGVDTSFLVATLTAALQELNAKFEAYVLSHP